MQRGYVQLNDPALAYPIYRTESKEQFERAIRQDPRNSAITDYLPADLDQFSPDLREALTGDGGLLDGLAKEDIAVLLRSGAGNPAVAQHLSQGFRVQWKPCSWKPGIRQITEQPTKAWK